MAGSQVQKLLRVASGVVALVAAFYAIRIGIDLVGTLMRPANQGWVDILFILFLPIFIGIALLAVISVFFGRYAWRGAFF
jgi:hypothetical protein